MKRALVSRLAAIRASVQHAGLMEMESRRPLKSRSTAWARGAASFLTKSGVRPNAISAASMVFALAGAACFAAAACSWVPWWAGWIAGAVMIQLRLVCNLMDGMVAVEGGHRTPTGDLWNEIPDRFADAFLLVGAGWAAGVWPVGALAAWAAVMTAYIRITGALHTGRHDFRGPFAKPQRMAALTMASLVTAFDSLPAGNPRIMVWCLWIVALGTLATFLRRTVSLASELKRKDS